ncbi:hypothetical protein KKD72_02260 [Patescibacteria group bacterium]|nr:hypothetical protein [Patescibacteria group bacterium]
MTFSGGVIFKDLFLDALWAVLYFPVWWYGRGLKDTAIFCWKKTRNGWRALAISILLINFFKPMYGQSDFLARVLSIITHLVQVLGRLALFFCWAFGWLIILILWIVFPLYAFWELIV